MQIAGVEVSAAAAAQLGVRLDELGQRALAYRVHAALADNSPRIGFYRSEYPTLLNALTDPPAGLAELHDALQAEQSTHRHRRAG